MIQSKTICDKHFSAKIAGEKYLAQNPVLVLSIPLEVVPDRSLAFRSCHLGNLRLTGFINEGCEEPNIA